jgi:hypothetical protein
MRWAEQVACMGDIKRACKILVGKTLPLQRRPMSIKKLTLKLF